MKTMNWAKITGNLNDYLLLLASLTATIGAIVYYLYSLNRAGIMLSLILVIVGFVCLRRFFVKTATDRERATTEISSAEENSIHKNKKASFFIAAYVAVYVLLIVRLWAGQSGRALISPWETVPSDFFWFYGLASLLLILILGHKKIATTISPGFKILFLAGHYLISLAVAVIVYKIGYGYDPFIHQATMELIAKQGVVLPKTPYYLGEYGLIVTLHKITGLSIYLLNKILVPCLTALFLPLALYRLLKNAAEQIKEKVSAAPFLTVLFLLCLTFAPFVATTPQNLSYLFLILTVLAGFSGASPAKISLLALATAAIHPLTGLPALGWTAWLIFEKYHHHLRPLVDKIIKLVIFLFTALSLPIALLLSGGNFSADGGATVFREALKNIFAHPGTAGQENFILNFIYLLKANYNLLLIVVIIIATLWYFYQHRPYRQTHDRQLLKTDKALGPGIIFINLALLIAYFLSSQIRFNDLIHYEQNGYADRILIIIVIFFLPFIALALQTIIIKIRQEKMAIQAIWLIFGLELLSAGLYLSYPRFDKYFNSHGYSTSINDRQAVKLVEQMSSVPYIALANQQVSAAALNIFGFDRYYRTATELTYFYPVPTGGTLYEYYLKMVYEKPDKKFALAAMDFVGVDEAYLIVNKYWHQSGRIINEAKLTADEWRTIDGEIYIFKYSR